LFLNATGKGAIVRALSMFDGQGLTDFHQTNPLLYHFQYITIFIRHIKLTKIAK